VPDRDGKNEAAQRAERQLAAVNDHHRRLMRERARVIADHVPLAEPLGSKKLRAMLSAGDLLLYYVLGEDKSFVFVVEPQGEVKAHDIPASEKRIQALASRFVSALAAGASAKRGRNPGRRTSADTTADVAKQLGSILVPGSLWRRIAKARRVFVIPDGPLHRVPFEALAIAAGAAKPKAKTVSWLDVGPPIAYAASGSALRWVLDRAGRRRANGPKSELVAFGDPVFVAGNAAAVARPAAAKDTKRTAPSWADAQMRLERGARVHRFGALPRLPGTRREIEAISRVFADDEPAGRVTVRLGEDATEVALYELAPRARYLHLATHGIFDEVANASYSAVALTVPGEPSAADDGFLTLQDLFTRWRGRLSGCDMVVLSACRTQVGSLQQDDAVQALPVGMLYAGASSVVASLWNVDDASTALLMADFYKRIHEMAKASPKGRVDRLAALHAAKRELKRRYPSPFYWAPFVYIGSPR